MKEDLFLYQSHDKHSVKEELFLYQSLYQRTIAIGPLSFESKTLYLYSNKETEGRNEHNMFHIGRRGRVGGTKIRLLSSTGRFPKT